MQDFVSALQNNSYKVSLNDAASGVYFVSITADNAVITKKIIKK